MTTISAKIRNISKTFILSCAAFMTAVAARAETAAVGKAHPWQISMPEPVSPGMEKLSAFHNGILIPIIFGIVIFVTGLLLFILIRFREGRNPVPSKVSHNVMLEIVWTLVPVLILVMIVVPSMKLLYFIDRTQHAEMTIKATGHQWYWSYDYPDHGEINFMSNMVQDADLKEGQPRLLATDNPVVVPVDTNIRLLVTASDVLHAWAVPSFGVKLDAVPGRLNETWFRVTREGVYYGQCSELCGVNHGFMPIEVHAVSKEKFAAWVAAQGGNMPADETDKTSADTTEKETETETETPVQVEE